MCLAFSHSQGEVIHINLTLAIFLVDCITTFQTNPSTNGFQFEFLMIIVKKVPRNIAMILLLDTSLVVFTQMKNTEMLRGSYLLLGTFNCVTKTSSKSLLPSLQKNKI